MFHGPSSVSFLLLHYIFDYSFISVCEMGLSPAVTKWLLLITPLY
jgi:hypothetical protein